MYRIYLFLVSLIFLNSCDKPILDDKDPFDVGEKIYEGFSKGDSALIWSLFDFNSESKYLRAFREANDMAQIDFILKKSGQSKLIKVDTFSMSDPFIEILFSKGGNVFKIDVRYFIDSVNNEIKINSYHTTDISKICHDYLTKPYIPLGRVLVSNFLFKTGKNNEVFESGELDVTNNTDFDIDLMTFRFKIFHSESEDPVFNQTIKSNLSIPKGDMKRINVLELQDYFIGKIINDKTITFDFELIEVSPKPVNTYCETLSNIKN